jgi:ubiquinone/menaquinone biosynthesis C-methylase UbiE
MIKSKAWNWKISADTHWEEPSAESYPLLKRWKKRGFKKLLDLGCGLGRHAVLFAENNFDVDAFDLSPYRIKKLKEFSSKNKLSIKTKVGDMLELPYNNNQFDCVISFHTIYHTDYIGVEKSLKEVKRVLTDNGEAFVTFNSQNSSTFTDPGNKFLTANTVIKTEGEEKGVPHFYAKKENVEKLLKDFRILDFFYKEEYYPDFTGAHYFTLIKKI